MTTSPVTTLTDELLADLEASASYCVTEVIRSHSWSEQEFDLLRADERYVRAASPELVVALLAERAELKKDAERLQKLADSMTMSFGREDYGLWLFPLTPVPSYRSGCTLQDLRLFIDTEYKEPAQ